jgi:hypothetical protein
MEPYAEEEREARYVHRAYEQAVYVVYIFVYDTYVRARSMFNNSLPWSVQRGRRGSKSL